MPRSQLLNRRNSQEVEVIKFICAFHREILRKAPGIPGNKPEEVPDLKGSLFREADRALTRKTSKRL